VIHVAENNSKQHMTDAEDHRDFHLERVEKRDFVSRRLPSLREIHAQSTKLHRQTYNCVYSVCVTIMTAAYHKMESSNLN